MTLENFVHPHTEYLHVYAKTSKAHTRKLHLPAPGKDGDIIGLSHVVHQDAEVPCLETAGNRIGVPMAASIVQRFQLHRIACSLMCFVTKSVTQYMRFSLSFKYGQWYPEFVRLGEAALWQRTVYRRTSFICQAEARRA